MEKTMPKLVWSVLDQGNNITQPLLDMFKEVSSQAQVEVNSVMWDTYKQEFTSMAIHGHGIDVSQAGAPVVNDLVAMNALRPFTAREMTLLGGESAFIAAAWNSSLRFDENKVWAIPLFSDPYAIAYWSDMLEQAGIDEKQAFTLEHIEETFQRLQTSGIEYPWLTNFHYDKHISIHGAAGWVWAQNTDFVSKDAREALFAAPAALTGLKAYFRLAKFVSPACLRLDSREYERLFLERRTAATICNLGYCYNWYQKLSPELRPRLKVVSPPGQPLVGGSSLFIWKNTRMEEMAFNLVKFLVSPEIQSVYPLQVGQMPVREEVFSQPPFSTNPLLLSYVNILKQGRVFPVVKFSGLLEDQITEALNRVWHTILSEPDTDLDTVILNNLNPLARRYENMMRSH
jgi:ABC-type glycerol-3-phosphate transport system substrate-binding protein